MSAEERLKELGIALAPVTPPVANYVNAVRTGNLLFLAGKGPGPVKGKLGREFTIDQGYQHARSAVGMGSLPMGIPVEIEVIVEISSRKKKSSRKKRK